MNQIQKNPNAHVLITYSTLRLSSSRMLKTSLMLFRPERRLSRRPRLSACRAGATGGVLFRTLLSSYCTRSTRYLFVHVNKGGDIEISIYYILKNALCRAAGLVFQARGSCRSSDGEICHSK